ncbi:hypothetical protein OE88DRAFT_1620542 [Heliocybe sulcata]|uniref:Carbohydrate esterase family 16 protein n=1 Tax=Heliocybe sulcata TaxID=5364 RepID=A0A5C3NHL1_9AGAM|nr:hypothetical protein OE88DRAFT_1620542 [Heliocybe sulcata]
MSWITPLFAVISAASALTLPTRRQFNDGVHLAISPTCGTLGGSPANVNSGLLPLNEYKTIVVFGDGYSSNGVSDGSTAEPAIVIPPSPKAGGRMSDGPVWTEYLAADSGATLKNYAVDGAYADKYQWPNTADATDSTSQVNYFVSQDNYFDPDTTLYIMFFGINTWQRSYLRHDNTHSSPDSTGLAGTAETVLYNSLVLASSPTFAKYILLVDNHGLGKDTTEGAGYRSNLFSGMTGIKNVGHANVGFIDFNEIWDGVLNGSPGYHSFGYVSPGACTESTSNMFTECLYPFQTFYWMPEYPSTQTHRIMATFVEEVFTQCSAS